MTRTSVYNEVEMNLNFNDGQKQISRDMFKRKKSICSFSWHIQCSALIQLKIHSDKNLTRITGFMHYFLYPNFHLPIIRITYYYLLIFQFLCLSVIFYKEIETWYKRSTLIQTLRLKRILKLTDNNWSIFIILLKSWKAQC